MNPREKFGIYPCPNPIHKFVVGKMLCTWQMAEDYWCVLDIDNQERGQFLHIGHIKTMDGLKVYEIIIWKFKFAFGFFKE